MLIAHIAHYLTGRFFNRPTTKEGDTKFEVFGLIREHNTGKQTMLKHAAFTSQVYIGRLRRLKTIAALQAYDHYQEIFSI